MGHSITLPCADGVSIGAWRAELAGRPKSALVVLQEIFGVNSHMRSVTDRFAEAGYLAIAPALFDRVRPGVEIGYEPDNFKVGLEILGQCKRAETMLDVAAAILEASEGGKVGVTGFCWGGSLTYLAAALLPGVAAGVGYYGGNIAKTLPLAPKRPLMLHFGEKDTGISMSDVAAIRAANPDAKIFTYPAGHAFNRDASASAYDAPSAALAMQRTLAFFAEHL